MEVLKEILKELQQAKKDSLGTYRTGDYRIGLTKAETIVNDKLLLYASSLQLKEKETPNIEGIDTIYLDKNGKEMVLLSNITMTIEQYRQYTETID